MLHTWCVRNQMGQKINMVFILKDKMLHFDSCVSITFIKSSDTLNMVSDKCLK